MRPFARLFSIACATAATSVPKATTVTTDTAPYTTRTGRAVPSPPMFVARGSTSSPASTPGPGRALHPGRRRPLRARRHAMSPLAIIGWLAGGYVLWTLTEYWLHRIVFHFEPEDGHRRAAALDHPRRPPRPPERPEAARHAAGGQRPARRSCSPCCSSWCSARRRMHVRGRVPGRLPRLRHDCTTTCTTARPRTALGRWLRELHMRHHFQDDTRGYGVSAPWWDSVFRTAYRDRRK